MKCAIKWPIKSCFVALAAALATSSAAVPVPLLHYTFNEPSGPALDTGSAPAADGTLTGSASRLDNTPGGAGSALNLNFPGATNYLSSGNPAKLNNLTNFTLTTWVNLQGSPAVNDRLLDKLSSTGGFGWKLNATIASSVQLGIHVNSTAASVYSSANVNLDSRWVFLAVTYDGTQTNANVRFYDGTPVAAVAQLGNPLNFPQGRVADTSNEFRVGSTAATPNDRTPPAWYDDVRIYNAVLSNAELEAIRSENLSGSLSVLEQPEDQITAPGSDAVFGVVGGGVGPIRYQWYFASQPISGASRALLTLTNVTAGQAGEYFVVLTNSAVSVTSRIATLTVASQPLYGPGNNVLESASWTLLYSLLLPNTAAYNSGGVPYSLDHHAWVTAFSRVAYYLELQQSNGPLQFVWVAMDAFTSDPARLGVPAFGSGAVFQEAVNGLDVRSGVPGFPNGTNLSGGTIKFIPGDDTAPASSGRGAMQVKLSGQVLFAFNGWGAGEPPDLGIGNNSGTNVDWTLAANAATYSVKRLLVYALPRPQATPVDADIVVYGGSSGGAIAAVQAARMGKRAVLLCQDNHIGGLSSGGLGWTDIGSHGTGYIGGLPLDFYQRNGARYGQTVRFNLEPHVAEQIFGEMLTEAGVQVFFNQRVSSAVTNGLRLAQLTTEDGSVYRGKMFIDTTYEGDLLPLAGATFTVGREATNTYGESTAGVLNPGNGGLIYDPYIVPGNAGSGLLPLIMPVTLGSRGSADGGVQAYNFRMCFTQTPANFLPMTPPWKYQVAQFELLARYIEALVAKNGSVSLGQFMTVDRPPAANKYDINNNGQVSTDFVGQSLTWPTNTSAGRLALRRLHEDYTRGFFTFLATNPRIPANVRAEMRSWGMCQDEFLDTGGWPHAIYVREARRLVGDYVMAQQDCQGGRVAEDSIGLAAYAMDSHLVWRLAQNGQAMIEGGMFNSVPDPFPISYRSLIPRAGECENLLCTFALSASHVAFASCRMEPVFMITSQSAATAAAFAIDDRVSLQQLSYPKLALQLHVDGQQLGSSASYGGGIIVDNADTTAASVVGDWTASTATTGYWGMNYLHDGNTNKGACSVTFTPALPSNGVYQIRVRWTANPNRAVAVPIDIVHPAGTNTFTVDQQTNGGAWVPLLTTNFNAGSQARVVIRNHGTTGYVIADAVQFFAPGGPIASVQAVASVGTASTTGGLPGRITFVRAGDTDTPLTVQYTLSGTASNGVDYLALPGVVEFPAGAAITNLSVVPRWNPASSGTSQVTLSVQAGTNYTVGTLGSASVTLLQSATPPAPTLLLPVAITNSWRLTCLGVSGLVYEFQRAATLTNTWSVFGTVAADTNGLAECLDSSPFPGQSFYRVQVQLP